MHRRHYGTPIPADLVVFNSGGVKSTSLTPGATAQPVQWQLPGDIKHDPNNGDFACMGGFWVELSTTFDQAAAGGSVINEDQLPIIMQSYKLNNNDLFGDVWSDLVYTGPIAKHLIERIGNGYDSATPARAQIASTDGDSTVSYFQWLPFGQANTEFGEEAFWQWTGWWKNAVFTTTLAPSTAIAAFSTGAVIKNATVLKVQSPTYSMRRPPVPLMSIWKRYLSTVAAAGNVITLRNFGDPFGIKGLSPFMRVNFLAEIMNVLGLGGVSTLDTITSFTCAQLSQPRIDGVNVMMREFRRQIGHVGPVSINAATGIHDGAGWPQTMAATPNADQAVATAMFLPLRYPGTAQRFEQMLKWEKPADLTYYRDQPAGGPSSGNHLIVSNEIHEVDTVTAAKMSQIAGIPLRPIPINPRFRGLSSGQSKVQPAVFNNGR